MKKKLLTVAPFIIVITIAAAIAVAAIVFRAPAESWAYDYEPGEEILSFGKNGKARYKGESYEYTKEDQYIVFTAKGGETFARRYKMTTGSDGEEILFLYEPSVYSYVGEDTPDGPVGLWDNGDGWSFRFNENGTFVEDTFFSGYYSVEEDAGRVKLMYSSEFRFQDTYIYYRIEGDRMTVEYPWRLVKTKRW